VLAQHPASPGLILTMENTQKPQVDEKKKKKTKPTCLPTDKKTEKTACTDSGIIFSLKKEWEPDITLGHR
jgi:hypothetical protein